MVSVSHGEEGRAEWLYSWWQEREVVACLRGGRQEAKGVGALRQADRGDSLVTRTLLTLGSAHIFLLIMHLAAREPYLQVPGMHTCSTMY